VKGYSFLSAVPPRARIRYRASAVSLAIASAVVLPLLTPTANASAVAAIVAPAPAVKVVAHVTTTRVVRQTLAQRVVTEARRHYGAPYRWGATGPRSFDCSGLTQYVFRKVGVRLPRTAASQYHAVRHVSRSSKRVGDLIFFATSSGYIHHVGIYVGGSRIIAATHTGDVVRTEPIRGRYMVGRVR
jgi:cell wall-associated NlpC family hydrolase